MLPFIYNKLAIISVVQLQKLFQSNTRLMGQQTKQNILNIILLSDPLLTFIIRISKQRVKYSN